MASKQHVHPSLSSATKCINATVSLKPRTSKTNPKKRKGKKCAGANNRTTHIFVYNVMQFFIARNQMTRIYMHLTMHQSIQWWPYSHSALLSPLWLNIFKIQKKRKKDTVFMHNGRRLIFQCQCH